MTTFHASRSAPRRHPWFAAALSLACPGLGQVYAGRVVRGLALLLATWLIVPVAALVVAFGEPSTARLVGLLGAVALALGVVVFSIIDAAILAAGSPPESAGGAWSRPAVCGLLLVLGLVGSAASAAAVRTHLFSAYVVPQGSMAPTIEAGDRILVRRLGAGARAPEPGRVVVFRSPDDRRQAFIKRVAARSGVPAGHFWALGDAADNSYDSRSFGPVPVGDVLGEAQYIFWPPRHFGTISVSPTP